MVILGVTLVPFLHGARVFTAYEYLERRFDPKTRSLTAFLFLCSRGMSCGTIIAAPAVVFSAIFGWDLIYCVALIGVPTVLYTMFGGVQAVTWADVKQMVLVVVAITLMITVLLVRIPVDPDSALRIAGTAGRLKALDFSFDINNTYTFWSGLIGGAFLMMSYFGTDQSQAQRYLTARSVDEARTSLLISAYAKIPLQVGVLMIGVLVFLFYVFNPPPLLFNPSHEARVREAEPAAYAALNARHRDALASRAAAARGLAGVDGATGNPELARAAFHAADSVDAGVRTEALALAGRVTGEPTRDVNYIIPRFVLTELPLGLAGLFIAAAMIAAIKTPAKPNGSTVSTKCGMM
jgi:Na+/proline symporter